MKTWDKIFLIVLIIVLAGYSYFIESNRLELNKYAVHDDRLKGVKIVFADDFYVKPYGQKRLEKVVKMINTENPEFVFVCWRFCLWTCKAFNYADLNIN